MTISSTRRPEAKLPSSEKKSPRPDSDQHRMHALALLAEKIDQLFQSYHCLG
ncbi:hypothetical protein [Nitrosospira sp. Nsp11]|uniref:hypothetical protein n=1 Tax=Nitrosospira sp. Nsp11 TaxID=1855338 RepID=UPI0015B5C4AA|nr:hypothetical protein [Nitrosospira sp. Nsp11]